MNKAANNNPQASSRRLRPHHYLTLCFCFAHFLCFISLARCGARATRARKRDERKLCVEAPQQIPDIRHIRENEKFAAIGKNSFIVSTAAMVEELVERSKKKKHNDSAEKYKRVRELSSVVSLFHLGSLSPFQHCSRHLTHRCWHILPHSTSSRARRRVSERSHIE